jgi:hypothetical protein
MLAAIIFAAVFVIGPILGVLYGCLCGWVVGHFWPHTMALLIDRLGLQCEPWQLGAMLGFVGGFFRSTGSSGKD